MKLATTYLQAREFQNVDILLNNILPTPYEYLLAVCHDVLVGVTCAPSLSAPYKERSDYSVLICLQRLNRQEFWEITDRGTNMNYLTDGQKGTLQDFFQGYAAALGLNPDSVPLPITQPWATSLDPKRQIANCKTEDVSEPHQQGSVDTVEKITTDGSALQISSKNGAVQLRSASTKPTDKNTDSIRMRRLNSGLGPQSFSLYKGGITSSDFLQKNNSRHLNCDKEQQTNDEKDLETIAQDQRNARLIADAYRRKNSRKQSFFLVPISEAEKQLQNNFQSPRAEKGMVYGTNVTSNEETTLIQKTERSSKLEVSFAKDWY